MAGLFFCRSATPPAIGAMSWPTKSFEDPEIAALMNQLYVNIKVDREERPDVDQIYMAALHATGEQGGWPLTMFLTPEGKPFWGGTYFPKQPRFGRPGFAQVLEAINRAWNEKKESINHSAIALTDHVKTRLTTFHPAAEITQHSLTSLADSILSMIDPLEGGLRGAPKFPNAPFMEALWLNWLATGNVGYRDAVLDSLRHMLNGGIYDHIGGGLSRYSTDASWQIPHFEKMLYDNALLVRLATWAYAETDDILFRTRIEETVDWLVRELRVEGGGFASSLDADSEGEEGRFYTWNRSELADVLGNDLDVFLSSYGLAAPDHWEGDPVVYRLARTGPGDELKVLREKLLAARETRPRPGRDNKVLMDWNGLAIAAIAQAGRLFARPDWITAAEAAFHFGFESRTSDGRLPHSVLGSKRSLPGLASDYAAMCNAAVSLYEATQNAFYHDQAAALLRTLDDWYLDDEGTGYFLTASDCEDVPIRIRSDVDEATPSATGQIIEAMMRTANLTGDVELHQKALVFAEAAFGRALAQPHGQAGIFNACALALSPMKLVIVEDPNNDSLIKTANDNPDPRRVDILLPLGAQAAAASLPGGIYPETSRSGAWLCTGQTCLPVITDPAELEQVLRRKPL